MDRLRIAHLHARYRLPAGAPAARERLDAVLRQVMAEALEHALDRAGVPAHEEVCIRHVHAPVRLRLGTGDSTLLAEWSVALADAITRAADGRGGGVVRYGSRPHALADVLLSAAAGDLRRAWAWRQMGLWREGDSPSPRTAAVEAVRALLAEPEAIVPVLRQAARAGALPALAARLDAESWVALARTALAIASAPRALGRALFDAPSPSADVRPTPLIESPTATLLLDADPAVAADGRGQSPSESSQSPKSPTSTDEGDRQVERIAAFSPAAARLARRVAASSAIAHAVRGLAVGDATVRRALAVLAVLDAEPAALTSGGEQAVERIAAVEADLASLDGRSDAVERLGDRELRVAERARRERERDARRESRRAPAVESTGSVMAVPGDAMRDGLAEDGERDVVARDADRTPVSRLASSRSAESSDDAPVDAIPSPTASAENGSAADGTDEEDGFPIPVVRTRGRTEMAGVLFLLHVVDELRLPDKIVAGDVFATRSLPWVLHRLAMELAGVAEDDATALAFAGLGPESDPPTRDEAPATAREAAEVEAMALRIAERLRARLRRDERQDPARALRETCRRTGEIVADPGWIEARLDLREVTAEVRRAGLDRDPGYLRWLGAVVRFAYV